MQKHHPQRSAELRAVITDFLNKRLADKLDGIKGDADEDAAGGASSGTYGGPSGGPNDSAQKRQALHQQFQPATWLADAARRAAQIQAVTHSLKPIHPKAEGTSLYCPPTALASVPVVGSHCLGDDFAGDVVGNAAALDVYKFLKLEHQSQSLLALSAKKDADFSAALSSDPAQANAWMAAFAALANPRGRLASHTLAKQLYWPVAANAPDTPHAEGADDAAVSGDLHDDASYHLLAPLYATSLAHRVYQTLQDDRFSDDAKAAREARKANAFSERPVRDYPHLAVQQMGGTKPQNISQLNSERRGNNSLLASLPPVWRSVAVAPLLGTDSLFARFGRRQPVRAELKALLDFLKTDPARSVTTRRRRAAHVEALLDEFLQFTAELHTLPPGWSQTNTCHLPDAQARWLDPDGAAATDAQLNRPPALLPTDVAERVCDGFAHWLNAQLHNPLPVGDPEFDAWRKAMAEAINADEREANHVH